MEFEQLKKEIREVGLETLRTEKDDYLEAVIVRDKLEQLISILESRIGPSVEPYQDAFSKEIQEIISEFGGIREGQSLHFEVLEDYSMFTMIWPWGDGENITIKAGRTG